MFPTVFKKGTVIIQADEICLGTPAQSVTDMDGRGAAAVHLLFTMRTMMNLIKIFFTGI
jgi:hypothetical protein